MAIDLTPKPAPVMGALDLEIDEKGIIRGFIYVSANNIPQGHIQVAVANMEAFKMFSNQIVQWIQAHDKAIQIPTPDLARLKL